MEKQNELKQIVKEKDEQIAASKDSGCCGPTCCGRSNNKKNSDRKEKENGNTK